MFNNVQHSFQLAKDQRTVLVDRHKIFNANATVQKELSAIQNQILKFEDIEKSSFSINHFAELSTSRTLGNFIWKIKLDKNKIFSVTFFILF